MLKVLTSVFTCYAKFNAFFIILFLENKRLRKPSKRLIESSEEYEQVFSTKKKAKKTPESCKTVSCFYNSYIVSVDPMDFKELIHPKMKISLLFTHPQAILDVYDFLISDESNLSYIKNGPGSSKLYHCSRWVFLFHILKMYSLNALKVALDKSFC